MRFKSNLGRTCQIGWLRRDWDAGGGAGRRKRHSRGGPSPEMVKLGRPGLDSSGAMAWEWVRIMRNPLGPTSASACASTYWALRPTTSSAKREKRSTRCSPRACGGRSCCAGWPASRMGSGARRSVVTRSTRGVSGYWIYRRGPCGPYEGGPGAK